MACNSHSDSCSNEYMDSSIDCNNICTKSSSISESQNSCNDKSDNLISELQNICNNIQSNSSEEESHSQCNSISKNSNNSCTSSIKLEDNNCYEESNNCYEESNDVYCNPGQTSSCNDPSSTSKAICDLRLDVLQILEMVGKMNKELCSQKKKIKSLCKNSNCVGNQITQIKKCTADSMTDCSSTINDEFAKLQDDMEKKIDIVKGELDTKFTELINSINSVNKSRKIHEVRTRINRKNLQKGYLI